MRSRFHTKRHRMGGRKSRLVRTRRRKSGQRGGDRKMVLQQFRQFQKDQENGEVPGIFLALNEENIESNNTVLIIGPRFPKQTEENIKNCKYPYEECLFFFHLSFPSAFPSVSPQMKHLTSSLDPKNIRLHPNLYERYSEPAYDGKVCLSILGTWAGPGWEPTMTLQSTLQTVQSILGPNALVNEPGFETLKDDDARVISYNHAVFFQSVRSSLNVYKMVLEASSAEEVPVEFIQPFYDELRERAYTAIRFYIRKLAVLMRIYPGGFKTEREIHHASQTLDYSLLYNDAFTLQAMIPPELAKEVESEDTSVRTAEEARRAEEDARRAARLVEMGINASGMGLSGMAAWFSTLPKPLPPPENFFWTGASANQMNYISQNYSNKGNANVAKRFRNKATLKRKVQKAKEVDPLTEKFIKQNNNDNNGNEYVYSNDETE